VNVPQQCADAECPMVATAKNFACHSGQMPPRSGICILLESPGSDEGIFLVKDLVGGLAEIERRRKLYPDLEDKWTRVGAPVVGRAGTLMWYWILQPLNLQRSDVAVFNTLHCYPGKSADGTFAYPKGNVRKRAEATCAHTWLQPLLEWDPTISVIAMHPSAISRDVTPLPVVLRAIEKAKVFAAKGERVLVLMGGKAAKHWMGYGENTTRWCGHFQFETEFTRRLRRERWDANRRLSVEKKVKAAKKLTAKTALDLLLSEFAAAVNENGTTVYRYSGEEISPLLYDAMKELTVTKKKVKEEVAA
jgi:hypothetical protein